MKEHPGADPNPPTLTLYESSWKMTKLKLIMLPMRQSRLSYNYIYNSNKYGNKIVNFQTSALFWELIGVFFPHLCSPLTDDR